MKKEYHPPKLTVYGTLANMTNGTGNKGRLDSPGSPSKGHKSA